MDYQATSNPKLRWLWPKCVHYRTVYFIPMPPSGGLSVGLCTHTHTPWHRYIYGRIPVCWRLHPNRFLWLGLGRIKSWIPHTTTTCMPQTYTCISFFYYPTWIISIRFLVISHLIHYFYDSVFYTYHSFSWALICDSKISLPISNCHFLSLKKDTSSLMLTTVLTKTRN